MGVGREVLSSRAHQVALSISCTSAPPALGGPPDEKSMRSRINLCVVHEGVTPASGSHEMSQCGGHRIAYRDQLRDAPASPFVRYSSLSKNASFPAAYAATPASRVARALLHICFQYHTPDPRPPLRYRNAKSSGRHELRPSRRGW